MRPRLTLLVVGALAAGGLLISPSVASAQPASTHSTRSPSSCTQSNPTPLLRTYPPQKGFDPLTATDAQLLKHGFPRRPTSPLALKAWKNAMAHATHYVAPDPCYSSVRHGPPPSASRVQATSASHTVEYSDNWAGHIVPQSVHGNVSFTYSQGEWTQPSVAGNSSYTNYQNAPDASFWDGIGVSDLIQAGADSIPTSRHQR